MLHDEDPATLDEDHLEKLTPWSSGSRRSARRPDFFSAPAHVLRPLFLAARRTDDEGCVGHALSTTNRPTRLAAIMATTAVLWICESLPMVVTALAAAVGLRVARRRAAENGLRAVR